VSTEPADPAPPDAEIGILGGSGFYDFFDDAATAVEVDTPFGAPSDPISVGEVAGRRVAFLPRHGRDHRFPPHRINYRANLWALRSLGVRQVLGPSAVGSLHPDVGPGTFVVPDQLIDLTWGREHTVYADGPQVVHVSLADPYCPRGRASVVGAADGGSDDGPGLRGDGTLVVINGPRFSTRAESRDYTARGGTVIGMTGMPEASIARELALCYTGIAMVTDHDAGLQAGGGVTHAQVLEVFAANLDRLRDLLLRVLADLPSDDQCSCRHAVDGLDLPLELP